MRRLNPCLVLCLILGGSGTAAAQSPDPPSRSMDRVDRLEAWIAAAGRHEPGTADDAVLEVQAWDQAALRIVWLDAGVVASLIREPDISVFYTPVEARPDVRPGRLPAAVTPGAARRSTQTQIMYSRSELSNLREIAAAVAGHADLKKLTDAERADADARLDGLLKRGAVLHTDVALFGRAAGSARQPGSGRVSLYMNDGQQTGLDNGAGHLDMARLLLDLVRPPGSTVVASGPKSDRFVAFWYLAVGTYLQAFEQWDPWHAERSLQLFADDSDLLFLAGCLHEALSSRRVQLVMAAADAPRDTVFDIGSEGAELREAERLYRRTLERDAGMAEARMRLGRVLGRRGRHEEAARQLRQAVGALDEGLLLHYAHLFLGAEEEALGHLDAAREAYARAAALYPLAQSPRLALSALAARGGNAVAASALVPFIGRPDPATTDDPWGSYHTSQARDVEVRLAELYRRVRVLSVVEP